MPRSAAPHPHWSTDSSCGGRRRGASVHRQVVGDAGEVTDLRGRSIKREKKSSIAGERGEVVERVQDAEIEAERGKGKNVEEVVVF